MSYVTIFDSLLAAIIGSLLVQLYFLNKRIKKLKYDNTILQGQWQSERERRQRRDDTDPGTVRVFQLDRSFDEIVRYEFGLLVIAGKYVPDDLDMHSWKVGYYDKGSFKLTVVEIIEVITVEKKVHFVLAKTIKTFEWVFPPEVLKQIPLVWQQ